MTDAIQTTLPIRPLLALREFAAKKDVRYYLKGIFVDLSEGVMVATNGHMMGVYRITLPVAPVKFIIPRTLLDRLKPSPLDVAIAVTRIDERWRVELETDEGSLSDWAIDGQFPDWRRVMPRSVSGETAQFNVDLLALCQKALKSLYGKGKRPYMAIGHNGMHAALLGFGDADFCGCIMPMRGDPPSAAPAWIDARPELEAAV